MGKLAKELPMGIQEKLQIGKVHVPDLSELTGN